MEKERLSIKNLFAGKTVRRFRFSRFKRKERMYILTDVEEFLCKEIVDCAYKVHKELGPGLLEKIYEACFCHELSKKEIPFLRQVKLPIQYDGIYILMRVYNSMY